MATKKEKEFQDKLLQQADKDLKHYEKEIKDKTMWFNTLSLTLVIGNALLVIIELIAHHMESPLTTFYTVIVNLLLNLVASLIAFFSLVNKIDSAKEAKNEMEKEIVYFSQRYGEYKEKTQGEANNMFYDKIKRIEEKFGAAESDGLKNMTDYITTK